MSMGYDQRVQERAERWSDQRATGSDNKIDYPHPKNLQICLKSGAESFNVENLEMQIYLEMKGFPHEVHLLGLDDKRTVLPVWFRRNNRDGILPMAKYDEEQYVLGSAEIMMALEKKFRVPLISPGGPSAGRFRGKTLKNLTLSLLKSVRPYDETNPDWVDLCKEFQQLNEYLIGCQNTDGDYLKTKRFSLWDIRIIPALYNLVTVANYFKSGFVMPAEDVPHLNTYMHQAFEDAVFKKFRPTVRQLVQYYEPMLTPDDV